ncbi:MAG: hypothetical protein AB1765_00055 [Candidatus Hydrogenedentota bacterium]
MKIVIVCIGSQKIGMGHIVRSLELKNRFQKRKIKTEIFHYGKRMKNINIPGLKSFAQLLKMGNNKTILLLDTKEVGEEYIPKLKKRYFQIVGLENTGKYRNALNLIIDSNINRKTRKKATALYGYKYVVIRKDILKLKKEKITTDTEMSCLIIPGGFGDYKWLKKVLRALKRLSYNGKLYVAGKWNKRYPSINFIPQSEYLKILKRVSFVIVCGGLSMFEALAIGKPMLAIPKNREQKKNIESLRKVFPYLYSPFDLKSKLMIYNREFREGFSRKARRIIDGKGAERIVSKILSLWK